MPNPVLPASCCPVALASSEAAARSIITPDNAPPAITIDRIAHPVHPGPVLPEWHRIAMEKGFEIRARVRDRYHLALGCRLCGAASVTKIFTLRTAAPLCPACLQAKWLKEAEAAGLTFLGRDPDARHYFRFRAPCSHVVRRQFELIRRIATERTGLRCETCHSAREAEEARVRGWTLIGPDPEGNPNYRLYGHDCGHRQRVARANMQTGRFGCGHCDPGWVAGESYLYAMRFDLPDGGSVVKLGFSRDPVSRLRHQLITRPDQPCRLLRQVRMRSGREALRQEKRLHSQLRGAHPRAVVDPGRYRHLIRVGSEIYEAALEPVILAALDRLEAEAEADDETHGGAG